MKPRIVVGIHTLSMINPHWRSLRPMINAQHLDILINLHPRLDLGENSVGGYGITKNFDLVVMQSFGGGSAGSIQTALAASNPNDVVVLSWSSKAAQAMTLAKLFESRPDFSDTTKWRQVKTFLKDPLRDVPEGGISKTTGNELDASSDELDHVYTGEAFRHARLLERLGTSEWIVLKSKDGAQGHGQIKMRREYYYDFMRRNNGNLVGNREHIKFSPDWFEESVFMQQGRNLISETKEVLIDELTVTVPAKFNTGASWLIQECLEDIDREFRFIMGGNKFWVREREISTGEYPQANAKFNDDDPGAESRMKYRRCENTNELDSRMVKFALALANLTNQRLFSIDFFLTKSGQLGVFEFSDHFGVDSTDASFVCDVWEAFIVNEAHRWAKEKGLLIYPGKSAYEMAVAGGYKWDQQTWVEGLSDPTVTAEELEAYTQARAKSFKGSLREWMKASKEVFTEEELRQDYDEYVKKGFGGSLEVYRKTVFEETGKKTDYEKAVDRGFRGSFSLFQDVKKWGTAGDYETAHSAGYRGTESEWRNLSHRALFLK